LGAINWRIVPWIPVLLDESPGTYLLTQREETRCKLSIYSPTSYQKEILAPYSRHEPDGSSLTLALPESAKTWVEEQNLKIEVFETRLVDARIIGTLDASGREA
jgi:hypothetical protein